jgi:hypothetical protein
MKCPSCQISFHPQMSINWVGMNASNANVYVYYQLCPECREPVVGYREQRKDESFVLSSDLKDLILLSKQKS